MSTPARSIAPAPALDSHSTAVHVSRSQFTVDIEPGDRMGEWRPFVGIGMNANRMNPSGADVGVYMTSGQLDSLIAALSTARDQARRLGIVTRRPVALSLSC